MDRRPEGLGGDHSEEWTRRLRHPSPVALGLALLAVGCAPATEPLPTPAPVGPTETPSAGLYVIRDAPVSFTLLSDTLPSDPELEGLVAPFRAGMAEKIGEVIGEATGPFTEARPEGSLGNFAADAVLEVARARYPEPVDMALVNNGGLRVPIPQGPITVGTMFELMPFENFVSVLVLRGSTVVELAQQLARRGGEPVAGLSFRIREVESGREAVDIRVGGQPLAPAKMYRLATSDFLASAGDDLSALLSAESREDLPILIRDAFIEYIQKRGSITPGLEGRIKAGGGR